MNGSSTIGKVFIHTIQWCNLFFTSWYLNFFVTYLCRGVLLLFWEYFNHSKKRLLVDFPTLILILHIWHLKSCEPVKSAHVNATEIGFNNCEQSPREKFAGGRRAECNMPTVSYKTVKSKFIELWAKYKHLKDYIKKKNEREVLEWLYFIF